jgi:hypothetical protein
MCVDQLLQVFSVDSFHVLTAGPRSAVPLFGGDPVASRTEKSPLGRDYPESPQEFTRIFRETRLAVIVAGTGVKVKPAEWLPLSLRVEVAPVETPPGLPRWRLGLLTTDQISPSLLGLRPAGWPQRR